MNTPTALRLGLRAERQVLKTVDSRWKLIDSLLLDSLYKADFGGKKKLWQKARKQRWSKLDSDLYDDLIQGIRDALPNEAGLWEIESH